MHYSNANAGTKLSLTDWNAYYLQQRQGVTNPLHLSGRLFQQFCVDQFSRIELDRFNYIKNNQSQLRADLYQGNFSFH